MKKQTKVLVAAAMLTLGASFSSMAALKNGTWVLNEGGWQYYNSKEEEYVDSTWCMSYGTEYYVDEDGYLASSMWVTDGDDSYYVQSDGSKTVNAWKYLLPDDDEAEEEAWFYFGKDGKAYKKKMKTIGDNKYVFDADGKMLTGWVDIANFDEADDHDAIGSVVYFEEDGARAASKWLKTYAPGIDEDEDDVNEDDMNWYYINSKGKAVTGKQKNLVGKTTYFFDVNGKMLSGWVGYTSSNYVEIGVESQEATIDKYDSVYFCGDAEDGHMKSETWIKEYRNTQYFADDSDNSQYWFWIQKNGEVFIPKTTSEVTPYTFMNGELGESVEGAFKAGTAYNAAELEIKDETYIFNATGEMKSGLISVDSKMYYYGGGSDGAKKEDAQTIADDNDESFKFYFAEKKGETKDGAAFVKNEGVTGNYKGYLYYEGLLVKAIEDKYEEKTIGTKTYLVNSKGSIQTKAQEYKEDGEVLVDLTHKTFANDYSYTK